MTHKKISFYFSFFNGNCGVERHDLWSIVTFYIEQLLNLCNNVHFASFNVKVTE